MTGADLKRRREGLGLTQQQLADHWGLHQAALSAWETGKVRIRHEQMMDDALRLLETGIPTAIGVSDPNILLSLRLPIKKSL